MPTPEMYVTGGVGGHKFNPVRAFKMVRTLFGRHFYHRHAYATLVLLIFLKLSIALGMSRLFKAITESQHHPFWTSIAKSRLDKVKYSDPRDAHIVDEMDVALSKVEPHKYTIVMRTVLKDRSGTSTLGTIRRLLKRHTRRAVLKPSPSLVILKNLK